jgi:hypothetical protein
MALSGTIHVRARVNGASPVEKSTGITVEPRDWAGALVEHEVRLVNFESFTDITNRPPPYPRTVHDLGVTSFGGTYLSPTDPGVLHFITDDGPNHRLAYLARVPVHLLIAILLHPQMASGSEFHRRQRVSASSIAQGSPCVQSGFDRYRTLILEHEGYPPNPNSHSGVFMREYQSRAGLAVEAVVVPNDQLQGMFDLYEARLQAVRTAADAQSDAEVDGQHPVAFGCNFDFTRR